MDVTMELIKQLREATGVGIMDCKAALKETGGDLEAAKKLLREQGKEILAEGRAAGEGRVEAYIHHSGKVGVLLEVNCNTDFTANSDAFRTFVHDVALHIASENPQFIRPEDVPEEVLEREREVYRNQARAEGKPEPVVEKIVAGRIQKFLNEACLLSQPFVRDPELSVGDLLNELAAKTGENIVIRRFARFEVGKD